jgi:uncharacterized protein
MDIATVGIVMAGALAGGFVNGLTGFGTALTALPFWLQGLPPMHAVQLSAACSIAGQLMSIREIWAVIDWRRIAPLVLVALLGLPIGLMLLPLIPERWFRIVVGITLILYSASMLLAGQRLRLTPGPSWLDGVFAFASGILGGLATLTGPPLIVWSSLKQWTKQERRCLFQVLNLTLFAILLITRGFQGQLASDLVTNFLIALPLTTLGVQAGVRLYRRLDDRAFDRLVLWMLLVIGTGLIARSAMAG